VCVCMCACVSERVCERERGREREADRRERLERIRLLSLRRRQRPVRELIDHKTSMITAEDPLRGWLFY